MGALDGNPAPPNSLAAVRASLESAAAFIEVDVNALAEGDYLLAHEAELEAETSGQGLALETPAEAARGLWIKQNGIQTEYPVALLSDVIRLFEESGGKTILQLDFKNAVPFASDEPLERLIGLIAPLGERVIVSSGADWQLRKLRKLAPWLQLGFDAMWYINWQPPGEERDPRDYPKHVGAYGYLDDHILASGAYWPTSEYLRDRCESLIGLVSEVSVFYLEHWLLAQSLRDGFNWAAALHERDILADAWTMDVTNPAAMQNLPMLLEAGVDIFTSNTPKALALRLSSGQERPSK
jgi:glycerophosphoryl diester phosphodiesterase